MTNNFDSEFIKKDKIVKHTVNGISRFLILWIIKKYGPIHGYRIMKEVDCFFESLIKSGTLNKSISSKIYTILKTMEENELVCSDTKIKDNKKVKFYTITEG
jgi:DNA-binding PadR family transcriptional regulator